MVYVFLEIAKNNFSVFPCPQNHYIQYYNGMDEMAFIDKLLIEYPEFITIRMYNVPSLDKSTIISNIPPMIRYEVYMLPRESF